MKQKGAAAVEYCVCIKWSWICLGNTRNVPLFMLVSAVMFMLHTQPGAH